ncbi:MAG: hypothetical protein WD939_09555 [Dehalococcoidia bacterium]
MLQDEAGYLPKSSCLYRANLAYDLFIDSLDALVILQTEARMVATCSDRDEGLAARLLTERLRYEVGEGVRIVLTVINCNGETITRRGAFRRSLAVDDRVARTVWRWDYNVLLTDPAKGMLLPPGRLIVIGWALWDQLDREGSPVPPGSFRVVGEFNGCNTTPPEQCDLSRVMTMEIVP